MGLDLREEGESRWKYPAFSDGYAGLWPIAIWQLRSYFLLF
jgi:hypothetical protein